MDFFSSYGIPGIEDNIAISFLNSHHDIGKVSAWDGVSEYAGFEFKLLGYTTVLSHEYSKRSDSFDMWSTVVNGYARNPSQKVSYWKDENGNIQYSLERYSSYY